MGSSCTPALTSLGQGAFLGQQVTGITGISSVCLAKGVIRPHSSANFPPLGFAPSQPVSMSERPPRLPQVCPSLSDCQTMPHPSGAFSPDIGCPHGSPFVYPMWAVCLGRPRQVPQLPPAL
ncbi:RING finger protein 224 [Platysternon megacephalum]|uniref:RING finger protein 224 n=1 Tax=Platysternon megacephalum TaxID=55544 RepID=A0A4D9E2D1_9SAUR|nr:RING finger protein 224 [Platysternon megacephalum]